MGVMAGCAQAILERIMLIFDIEFFFGGMTGVAQLRAFQHKKGTVLGSMRRMTGQTPPAACDGGMLDIHPTPFVFVTCYAKTVPSPNEELFILRCMRVMAGKA